jgi:hypothetical protein
MRVKWRRRRKPAPAEPRPTDLSEAREGARYYALCGDNMWGMSITWQHKPGEHPADTEDTGTYASIIGWLPQPRPEPGDVIVAPMRGGAGEWIVQSVSRIANVDDGFTAELRGVVGYLEPAPQFKSALELLKTDQRSEYV